MSFPSSRRLAVQWLGSADKGQPAKRLIYFQKQWESFTGVYSKLEFDYESAVNHIRTTHCISGFISERCQPSKSCSFGLAALTLWCMAWEGTLVPSTFNHHRHPAFGISTWLALQRRPGTNFYVPQQVIRRKFRVALEESLAAAIALAKAMNSRGMYLFEPRLLRPTIFDYADSPRLTKSKSVTY
jgi:hypothetical protein